MIEKTIVFVLVAVSLLALFNAFNTYKRSSYFERDDRVNVAELVENIEQLERERLIRLSKQLAIISRADYGVLRLLNREFRKAILLLGLSLGSVIGYLVYLQFRRYSPAYEGRKSIG